MATRWFARAIILFSSFTLSLHAQKGMANSGTWSGIIINSGCTADEAFAEAAKCTENRALTPSWHCMTIRRGRFTL